MEKLNQRTDCFTLVFNDSGADLFKSASYIKRVLCTDDKLSPVYVAVIKHDQDTNEHGDLVTVHYHCVLQVPSIMRLQTMLNLLVDLFKCNVNQITIDKCNSIVMQSRYLIHFDDVDKYQYDASSVATNNIDFFNRCLKYIKTIVCIDDLISVVKAYPNLLELMSVLGFENYRKYRIVIRDIRERV